MMTFYILAVSLVVLAIVLIAPPLWRGRALVPNDSNAQNIAIARERLVELEDERARDMLDEQSFAQAKLELEKTLAGDLGAETTVPPASGGGNRGTLVAVALLIPAVTLALYLGLGAPQHLAVVGGGATDSAHAEGGAQSMLSMDELLQRLTARLEKNPEDADGWFMLGRTYMQFENYAEAVKAYERLNVIVGEHPVALLALADALAMNSGGNISGRPAELAQKALQLEPTNITALWLVGMAAEEQGQYAEAVGYWQQIIPLLEAGDPSVPELQQRIASARSKLTPAQAAQLAKTEPASLQPPAAASGVQLKVRVALAPELLAKVDPESTVFVYARAMEGPAMPLAAARLHVHELPLEVVLDDSMAMVPTARLSNFDQVRVGARISRSGQAIAQSGDLYGELENVATGSSQTLSITIARELP